MSGHANLLDAEEITNPDEKVSLGVHVAKL